MLTVRTGWWLYLACLIVAIVVVGILLNRALTAMVPVPPPTLVSPPPLVVLPTHTVTPTAQIAVPAATRTPVEPFDLRSPRPRATMTPVPLAPDQPDPLATPGHP